MKTGESLAIVKRCPRCEQVKAPEAFGPYAHSSDGLQGWCKSCRKAPPLRGVSRKGKRAMQLAVLTLIDRHRGEYDALYADALAST